MSFVFPTNASQVQAFAGALFGVQAGSATMAQVNADILANGGLIPTLNGYYSATFSSTAVAAKAVATNLGLTGAALTEGTAYITAQLNAAAPGARGAVISNIANMFGTYTTDATFGAAATAWNTKVAIAASYTGASNVAIGSVVVTNSLFALTAGVDSPTGSAGNDTFIADNTGTVKTLSVSDQINGGDGTDTLNVYLAAGDTTTGQGTLTSIEQVYINGGAITAYTAPTGSQALSIDSPVALTNATYTLSGQTVTLKSALTASTGGGTTMTTTLASASTATSANVTLAGYTSSGTDTHVLAVTGAALTTLNLTSSIASNKISSLTNSSAALTTLNITGDKALALTDVLTGLKTYNASAATGAVTLTISGKTPSSTLSITGGAGNDKVEFGAGAAGPKSTMTLVGGAGTDQLIIADASLTNSAGINKATGFEQVGITVIGAYDVATVTSIPTYNVTTAVAGGTAATPDATGGATGTVGAIGVAYNNVTNQSFIFDKAVTGTAGQATSGTTSRGGVGGAAVNVTALIDNGSNAVSVTLSGVTLTGGAGGAETNGDAAGNGGVGGAALDLTQFEQVTLVSNKDASASATGNILTGGAAGASNGGTAGASAGAGLVVGTNATITITGTNALNAGVITGNNITVNAATLTGNLTATTGSGNDVITGGSGTNTITLSGGSDAVNLTASTAKADVITLTSASGSTLALQNAVITGFTNAATTGDKVDLINTATVGAAVVSAATATDATITAALSATGIFTFGGTGTVTLAKAIAIASEAAYGGATQFRTTAFEFGGNTYLVENGDTNAGFTAGTDVLVQLVGVTGITALSTTASGANTVFIA